MKLQSILYSVVVVLAMILLVSASGIDQSLPQSEEPAKPVNSQQPEEIAEPLPSTQSVDTPRPRQPDDEDSSPVSELPKQLLDSAREGRAYNNEFVVGKITMDQVEQKWGEPESDGAVGQGIYAEYNKFGVTFGTNQIVLCLMSVQRIP